LLRSEVKDALIDQLGILESAEVEVAIESDLPAEDLGEMLLEIDHPLVRAYYDTGNAAALGFSLEKDVSMLGNLITAVHVKDRVKGGTTLPLGEGDADFDAFFKALKRQDYNGPFILQTAFGPDYERFARDHLTYVRDRWVHG